MQLLTALGFGTGFTEEESFSTLDELSHAGLERWILVDNQNPYVIKSPWYADALEEALRDGAIQIYAALIPVRSLFDAAESRRRVYREAMKRGVDPLSAGGSLWHTEDPSRQEEALAVEFYKTVFPLIKHEVPTYFLEFPRLALDADYLFQTMELLMNDHGVERSEFLMAHAKVVRPELIHTFSRSTPMLKQSVSDKIRRNQACPCGSGKKYKHCHGALA
jgi:hypothetical protein